jgi:hypothetical protein
MESMKSNGLVDMYIFSIPRQSATSSIYCRISVAFMPMSFHASRSQGELTSQMAEQQTCGVHNIARGMTIVPYEVTHMYGMEKITFMQQP